MQQILEPNQHLSLLELVAFMQSSVAEFGGGRGLCIQLWTAGRPEPLILSCPCDADSTKAGGSKRSFAYNLLAVTLPRSQTVVWLPLVKTGYTDDSGCWQRRLDEVDQETAPVASASAATSVSKTQESPSGLRAQAAARLRCTSGGSLKGHASRKRGYQATTGPDRLATKRR